MINKLATSAERAVERIDKEFFGVNLTDNKLEEMAAIIEEETSLELIEAKHQMADGMVAAFESQIRGWQLRAAEGEQREAQLVEALKYARRFLNSIDHDTSYIDAALKPPTGETE